LSDYFLELNKILVEKEIIGPEEAKALNEKAVLVGPKRY
jgi:hypothetical protein